MVGALHSPLGSVAEPCYQRRMLCYGSLLLGEGHSILFKMCAPPLPSPECSFETCFPQGSEGLALTQVFLWGGNFQNHCITFEESGASWAG